MPAADKKRRESYFIDKNEYIELISSFSGDTPSYSREFAELELMVEWGLTPDEFNEVDISIIYRIIEFRQAKNKGESIKYKT